VIITPPQINKFYSMDLSPDKSLVQYLLKSGIQVFCVSWRNPTAKERDWGLDTYVAALDEATDAVREIASSDDVTMMGACSGGITSAAYAGWLARQGEAKVKNIVTPVCVLDAPPRRRRGCAACSTVKISLGYSRGCGQTISFGIIG
jgi:polyhydroxyalkanoate synthase subunit PhaC